MIPAFLPLLSVIQTIQSLAARFLRFGNASFATFDLFSYCCLFKQVLDEEIGAVLESKSSPKNNSDSAVSSTCTSNSVYHTGGKTHACIIQEMFSSA